VKLVIYVVCSAWLLVEISGAAELPLALPRDVGLSEEKLNRVKTLVQTAVDENRTAGVVVLIARRGKIAYWESFGKLNVEAETPMPNDAIFRIHSMTKPITTVAALVLYDEGKFKLDEPVSKFMPELKGLRVYAGKSEETVEANREVTIRDLMRHTSGFTYGMPNGSPVDQLYIANKIENPGDSLADMVGKLGNLPLQYQPGARFHYSVSTDVLGRLVEVLGEKPLDEFLRDRVFKPLDMKDTGFVVPNDQLNRFAASHRAGEQGLLKVIDVPATSRYRVQRKYLSGGGGLVSTARDYARFCQMLLSGGAFQGNRVLRLETVREMTSNQLPVEALPMTLGGVAVPGLGFGLGVSVALDGTTPTLGPAAGEFGWSGAASTYFWVAPKSELFVVVLQQVEPFNFGLQMALKPAIYAAIQE